MEKKLFFGYGANRNRSKIRQVIGRDPGEGVGAILEGYSLYLQDMEQIPERVRADLQKIFGNSFKSYTIVKGKGFVLGVIWAITDEELEKIKVWEYVGEWREIIEVTVKSEDFYTVKVLTEKCIDTFPATKKVDGLYYNELELKELEITKEEDEFYTKKQLEEIRKLLARHNSEN